MFTLSGKKKFMCIIKTCCVLLEKFLANMTLLINYRNISLAVGPVVEIFFLAYKSAFVTYGHKIIVD